MDNRWKVLFQTPDNPGLDLFCDGKVTNLVQNGDKITALVDDFPVEITPADGTPVQMKCSCPRTEELCCHMAAVLYATEQPEGSWEQEMQTRLDYIWDHPHLDHWDVYELIEDIEDALQHALLPLLRDGQLTRALKLIGDCYDLAVTFWEDPDICPEYYGLVEHCRKTWQRLFDRSAPPQREQMRLWFWEYMENNCPEKNYALAKLIFSLPWHPTRQKKNLEALAQYVEQHPHRHSLASLHQRMKEKFS